MIDKMEPFCHKTQPYYWATPHVTCPREVAQGVRILPLTPCIPSGHISGIVMPGLAGRNLEALSRCLLSPRVPLLTSIGYPLPLHILCRLHLMGVRCWRVGVHIPLTDP